MDGFVIFGQQNPQTPMASPYMIRLSVYPYIRKYLLFHFSEPCFISERGYLPTYIQNTLKHPPKVHPSELRKLMKVDYGSHFDMALGEGLRRKKGSHLTSEDVVKINEVIADLIHDEMYRLVVSLHRASYQVDDSIREYSKFYGFSEDELPFENLKRWYYRERARVDNRTQKQKEFTPQLLLKFFEELAGVEAVEDRQVALAI